MKKDVENVIVVDLVNARGLSFFSRWCKLCFSVTLCGLSFEIL